MDEVDGSVSSPAPAPAPPREAREERREEEVVKEKGDLAAASPAEERREENPSQVADLAVAAVSAVGESAAEKVAQGGGAAAATTMALAVAERTSDKQSGIAVVGLVTPAAGAATASGMKKKRGRPRKYAPDGSLARPLNLRPISASAPTGECTPATAVGAVMKMGRARPVTMAFGDPPQFGSQLESGDEMVACSAGANFTPHILTVAAGEFLKEHQEIIKDSPPKDVTMKIISFSQMGPQAICILSANGLISNVTLRQPDSFGGTLTYEGRFQLLSLSGSFIPNENGGTRSRSGGMSVSLASVDGRVIGGGVAGLLVAASPVQVVVGSFLPSYHMEQKAKKTKPSTGTAVIPSSNTELEINFGDSQTHHRSSATPKTNLTFSTFKLENWSSPLQSVPDMRNSVLV